MSASKRKGTGWESAIVDYLRANGAPHAERRALNGAKDRGDIAGLPGVVIEAKSAAWRPDWIDEAEAERRNDNMAPVAAVWHKRRGRTSPGDGLVTMTGAQFLGLLRTSGYITDVTESPRPGGAASHSPPPGGATAPSWAVHHPGIGKLPYPDEAAARAAAGTAGTLIQEGA